MPTTGPCSSTFGSQVWKGKIGAFTANPKNSRKKVSVWASAGTPASSRTSRSKL